MWARRAEGRNCGAGGVRQRPEGNRSREEAVGQEPGGTSGACSEGRTDSVHP